MRRRLHPEAAAPRRWVHTLTVGGVLRVLLLRRQIRFLRILLAVPLLIPLLLVGLLIPAGLHKPLLVIRLLVIRLLLIRLLGVWLLIPLLLIALPIRLLITLLTVWLLIFLLTIGLLVSLLTVWLLISLLTIGLLIVRIPLLTILRRLPIAVLRRVALTIGIIGRVAAIRGIALRRRIIALRKTGLLRILSGVPGAIIGWTAVAHPASFPFFRAFVREVPCRACGRRNCTLPRADFHASACFALYMITHLTV